MAKKRPNQAVPPEPPDDVTAENVVIPTPAEVRAIRDTLGLSQEEAAARIGLSRRTWQDYERGKVTITRSAALLIRLLEKKKL